MAPDSADHHCVVSHVSTTSTKQRDGPAAHRLVQFTEAKILSEFIKTDAYKMEVQARPPMAVTNAVSWRSEGIKYKKNEVRIGRSLAATMTGYRHTW